MAKTGTLKFQAHPYTPQARNSSDFAQYRPADIFRRRNARSNSEKSKNLKLLKLEPTNLLELSKSWKKTKM